MESRSWGEMGMHSEGPHFATWWAANFCEPFRPRSRAYTFHATLIKSYMKWATLFENSIATFVVMLLLILKVYSL